MLQPEANIDTRPAPSGAAPAFRFYATLLDAFEWYKSSEDDGAKQEFLDKINRVPTAKSDAQIRGQVFNDMVDAIASGKTVLRGDGNVLVHDTECPIWILDLFAEKFKHAVRQVYAETIVPTLHGPVAVYGFIDEILCETAYDIKTCSKYEFPKYLRNWQHPVYLECLHALAPSVNRFQYIVTDFRNVFTEDYGYNPKDTGRVQSVCAELIEFIEANRAVIIDTKIFGQGTRYDGP